MKNDLRYFKDARIDSFVPMHYRMFEMQRSIKSCFNAHKIRFHDFSFLEESFKNLTEKEEKSESKGKSNDKDLIYKSKIEKEINKNNNSIFESKSIKIKKDKMGETKNITIIKTVNKEEIIKSNNFDDKLNIAEKIVEKKVEKKERNPSYSERRKLFRKKYESYKKEQE